MIQLIAPEFHDDFRDELAEMHRLRGRVFKGRLGWAVQLRGDQEIDRFDALRPHYLLLYSDGRLTGSVRFLPTTGPTMLSETFADLLDRVQVPHSSSIWESSRFALDLAEPIGPRRAGLALETYTLFAGMIEFGLFLRLTQILTVTDVRVERILRRAGWPLVRLGEPKQRATPSRWRDLSKSQRTASRGSTNWAGFDGRCSGARPSSLISDVPSVDDVASNDRRAEAYDYALALSRRDWAWEFLRRNPSFRAACDAATSAVVEGRDSDVAVLHPRHTTPLFTDWGLIFRGSAA